METTRTLDPVVPSRSRTDLFSIVGAGLLWGTGGLTGALLATRAGVGPLAVGGYRLAVGGLIVITVLVATGGAATLRLDRRAMRRLLTVGTLAAQYQTCYFAAVSLTSVGIATLITLGSAPVVVTVAESVAGRRLPSRRAAASTAMAACGLVLLVGTPGAGIPLEQLLAGTVCGVLSAAGFAAITMLGARPVAGLGPLATTGVAFGIGGAITLSAAAAAGTAAVGLDVPTLLILVYLGVGPTALAYTLYFSGLRTVATGTAAVLALLEPVTATVLGVVLLGERLGSSGVLGAVLIGAAMAVAAFRRPAGPLS